MATTTTSPIWADAAAPLELPPLAGEAWAHTCVVGLGGSGLTAVLELRARGKTVVGIDAGTVGGAAAGRNGGFLLAGLHSFHHDVVRDHGRAAADEAYRLTLAELEKTVTETPEAVRRTGSLRIAADAAELADCRAHLAALQASGFPGEWYTGAEGEGLLIPTDAVFQPLVRCRQLARRALALDARLHEHTQAIGISGDGVMTSRGTIRCERVIVAVDGKLEVIFPELSRRIRTARLQMLATAPERAVRFPRPVYYRWGFEYWQQLADGRVALGGFRDQGGEGEWTTDTTPTEAVQQRLEAFLREHLKVQAPVTHRWAASVGYSADGLPLVEEVRPGVWVCGGYSGTGNLVGPLAARTAVALALGQRTPLADLLGC
jgi:glycine/D-amino acid oxidase-like deaminating enzyme